MDIYHFLCLFWLLFFCLLLGHSRRTLLLAKNVAVLIVIRKQVYGFLGPGFLLLGCKDKGVKTVRLSWNLSQGEQEHSHTYQVFSGFCHWRSRLRHPQTDRRLHQWRPLQEPAWPPSKSCPLCSPQNQSRSLHWTGCCLGRGEDLVCWGRPRKGRNHSCRLNLIPGKTDTAPARFFFPALSESRTEKNIQFLSSAISYFETTGFFAHFFFFPNSPSYPHSSGSHCGLFSLLAPQRTDHPGKDVGRHMFMLAAGFESWKRAE